MSHIMLTQASGHLGHGKPKKSFFKLYFFRCFSFHPRSFINSNWRAANFCNNLQAVKPWTLVNHSPFLSYWVFLGHWFRSWDKSWVTCKDANLCETDRWLHSDLHCMWCKAELHTPSSVSLTYEKLSIFSVQTNLKITIIKRISYPWDEELAPCCSICLQRGWLVSHDCVEDEAFLYN